MTADLLNRPSSYHGNRMTRLQILRVGLFLTASSLAVAALSTRWYGTHFTLGWDHRVVNFVALLPVILLLATSGRVQPRGARLPR